MDLCVCALKMCFPEAQSQFMMFSSGEAGPFLFS